MKRIATTMAALLLMVTLANAQVFMLDKDGKRQKEDIDNVGGFIPLNGVEYDQGEYVPTGSGALLLAALGGAYLVGKRRKK